MREPMERLKFSVTDMKNANRCPRLFVLNKRYKMKIWRYSGIVIGSLVHHAIDAFIKKVKKSTAYQHHLQEQRSSEAFFRCIKRTMYSLYLDQVLQFKDKIKQKSDLEYYKRGFNRGWNILQNAAELIHSILYPPLSKLPLEEAIPKIFLDTEWAFKLDLEVDNTPFTISGRIDWISHDLASQRVLVWDFKTSESDYMHLDFVQIALYTIAIKEKLGIDADPAIVYFTEDSVKILEFNRAKIAKITPLFHRLLLNMRKWYLGEEIPPQTVDLISCGRCNLQESCSKKFSHTGRASCPTPKEPINLSSRQSVSSLRPNHLQQEVLAQKFTPKAPSDSSPLEKAPAAASEECLGQMPSPIGPPLSSAAFLGEDLQNKPCYYPLLKLLRHTAIIGSTGSGKTVLGKVIIEEALKQDYSALLIDPQGDLCSILIPDDPTWDILLKRVHIKIFTPGSEKGIKLSLNPLQPPESSLMKDREYLYMLIDNVASLLLMIMGYSSKRTTPPEKAILESFIYEYWTSNRPLNFVTLANAIDSTSTLKSLVNGQEIAIDSLISSSKRKELIHNLMKMGTGTDGYFFLGSEHLNIQSLVQDRPSLYIINLASVGTDITKRQLVVSWILRQVYDWMLQHPQLSQDQIRFFLYFDEIADFLPPHPHDPPSKKMLTLLLRQARKYGVACILATQSPATIDYKALDNVSTFFVGKIPSEQSYKKILALVEPYFTKFSPASMKKTLQKIRTASPGTFLLFGTDQPPRLIQIRRLLSKHLTISLDQLRNLLVPDPSHPTNPKR